MGDGKKTRQMKNKHEIDHLMKSSRIGMKNVGKMRHEM